MDCRTAPTNIAVKKKCHIDWGFFVSYVPIHKRTRKKSINLMPKNANSKVLKIIIRLFWSREKVCLGIALCSKFRSCTFTTNCTLLDFEQYWFLKFSWIARKTTAGFFMSVEVLIDAARQNQQSKDVLYIFTLLVLTCRINVYFNWHEKTRCCFSCDSWKFEKPILFKI